MKLDTFDREIIYLSSIDINEPNGPGVNEREFVEALLKMPNTFTSVIIPSPARGIPVDLLKDRGSIFFTSRYDKRNPLSWLYQQITLIIQYIRASSRHGEDTLIITRASVFSLGILLITMLSNYKYLLKTCGDGAFEIFRDKNLFYRSIAWINLLIFRVLTRRAAAIDVVTEVQKRRLADKCLIMSAKIAVIDNKVNCYRFKPGNKLAAKKSLGIPEAAFVVGYAGNFPWTRGGRDLIKAVSLMGTKNEGIYIVILSVKKDKEKFQKLVSSSGLEKRVILLDQQPFERMPEIINAFDVGVSLLVKEKIGASEQKVRQYLACGVPVIVTRGSSDFIGEEGIGHVVEVNDIESVAKALMSWLNIEPEKYERIRQKARKFAFDKLSINSGIDQRLELFGK